MKQSPNPSLPTMQTYMEEPSTPAPFPRRVLAQMRFETLAQLKNGEQLLLSIIIPVLALVGLVASKLLPDTQGLSAIDYATPGVLALCVMSASFTGQAISTGFDRRYGVLRLLSTTPLGKRGLLLGKIGSVVIVQIIQVILISTIASLMGWRPELSGVFWAFIALSLGTVAFTALAMLFAGTLRAEATLALANIVWVLLVAGGGILTPVDSLPFGLGVIARFLPSGALGEAVRQALAHGSFDIVSCLILGLWALIAGFLAIRYFKWNS